MWVGKKMNDFTWNKTKHYCKFVVGNSVRVFPRHCYENLSS